MQVKTPINNKKMAANNNNNALEELDSIPKRVAYAIKESGLSTTDIASKMDFRESTIWRWTKLDKSNFKEREVIRLAKITGFNPYWILYQDKPVRSNSGLDEKLSLIKPDRAGSDYTNKRQGQIVGEVAKRLRSLGQELSVLSDALDNISDQ